ncbi:19511_t:CDS:2, partial [Entrophospora sp. SA101]
KNPTKNKNSSKRARSNSTENNDGHNGHNGNNGNNNTSFPITIHSYSSSSP